MNLDFDKYKLSIELSNADEWTRWTKEIPQIQFPSEWKVRLTPPFGGAVVRFRAHVPGMRENDEVSVYLDCYDRLGYFGEPYWEVYPYNGDVGRVKMDDIEGLLEMIKNRDNGDSDE